MIWPKLFFVLQLCFLNKICHCIFPLLLPQNNLEFNNVLPKFKKNITRDGNHYESALIIGAGPCGLATSLSLSQICNKVYLIEKQQTFDNRGSAFGMALNGQKTLDIISPGLRRDMEEASLVNWGASGKTLVFVWSTMRDILLQHVKQKENIELFTGEEFTKIHELNNNLGGVRVEFRSGLEINTDFVVGSDGIHSQVRNTLNLPPGIVSSTTNYRGSFEIPLTASKELQGFLEMDTLTPFIVEAGGNMHFVVFNFHKRHPRRIAWFLATRLDPHSDKSITIHSIIEQNVISEMDLTLLKEIFKLTDKAHLKPFPKTSVLDFSDETLSSYTCGGWGGKGLITLVGDAAHGMRPTDGYGGSMALEDAVVLTRILKDAAEKSKDPVSTIIPGLLRKFESERLPRVKKVHDNQNQRYETRMGSGKNPGPQSAEFLNWLHEGV